MPPKCDLSFDEILLARSIFAKHAEGKARTVHQLRSILSDLAQYPTQRELECVLDCFNYKVTFEDLARYLEFLKRSFMKPEPKDADTVSAFVALGGSNDRGGHIITDDLRNACQKFRLTIDIDEMLRDVDEDGSGEIEYNEFREMWEKNQRQDNVSFHVEEEAQSEDEYIALLRAFLTAERKGPQSNKQAQRQPSNARRRSRSIVGDSMGRRSTLRLPPVPTAQTAAAPKSEHDDSQSDDEETPQKPAVDPQRQAQLNDPAYRRYMMTDPVVVGSRHRSTRPTPRGAQPSSHLPPVSPRSTFRTTTGSRSPRRTVTMTPRSATVS